MSIYRDIYEEHERLSSDHDGDDMSMSIYQDIIDALTPEQKQKWLDLGKIHDELLMNGLNPKLSIQEVDDLICDIYKQRKVA